MKPAQNINEMKEQASKTFWGEAMKTVQRLSDARWHGLFEEQHIVFHLQKERAVWKRRLDDRYDQIMEVCGLSHGIWTF